ncbi:MAG: hypothetical protein PF961_14855 [Planctomycetota bacterium]|jgi:hypothetical protein|nr:hypothetical protein [Planctomycetota bacterium]
MRRLPASLLLHSGHGALHLDLLLGTAPRCETMAIDLCGARWRWRQQAPHRRRYLHYRGPVSGGRGRVRQLWHGMAVAVRGTKAWVIHLDSGCELVLHDAGLAGARMCDTIC